MKSGVPTALLSLVLALACAPETFLVAELLKPVGDWVILLAPPLILGVASTFAFSVRFALPALDGRRAGGGALAKIALVVAVVGLIGSVPIAVEALAL